tara:strand:- start:487 stop:948 length:462 start_codon:yes stop_codon:yes gene_type:complete
MIDPVTAIAGATAAFNALKKGIQVGKDLQDMGSQLSQWAGAMSDIDFVDKRNQKPSVFKVLGGGVESEAMQIFAAKKKRDSMRAELKDFISVVYGPSHWEELLKIEAEIRVQKKENEYRRLELQQTIIEWSAGITLFFIFIGSLFGLVWIGTR